MGTDTLNQWISDPYLSDRRIRSIAESVAASPVAKYTVLDDFFRPESFDQLHKVGLGASYSQKQNERFDSNYTRLSESDAGWDLFSCPEWHLYCAKLVGVTSQIDHIYSTNFHKHASNSNGFWIHRDDIKDKRTIVVIGYFNKEWASADGGLLRVWREDEAVAPGLKAIDVNRIKESPQLFQDPRVRCTFYGVGDRDYVLVDQIVPEYNRIVICNLQAANFWHSVTPSRNRERYGFIQFIS
jgi:hypothetical protein